MNTASIGTTFNHNVNFIIFHRRIEDFFDSATETVNFIYKKDVAVLEISQNGGKVTGTFNSWTGCHAEISAEFMRDDVRHGGLAEAGRAVEEDMVEGSAVVTFFDGVNSEFEIIFQAFLTNVVRKTERAKRDFCAVLVVIYSPNYLYI